MGMRYIGGGIGHKMLRGIVNISDTMKIILKDLEDEDMDEEAADQDRNENLGDPDMYTLDLGDEEWSDDEDDGDDDDDDEGDDDDDGDGADDETTTTTMIDYDDYDDDYDSHR